MPCQAKAAQESFFDVYGGRDRAPLDPERWIPNIGLNVVDDVESPAIQPDRYAMDATRLDAAIASWRLAGAGEGNSKFYQLGIELKMMGKSNSEIKTILKTEARLARSPAERERQIPSIMASLASWKAATANRSTLL